MKRITSIALTAVLTLVISSTAFAGNISGSPAPIKNGNISGYLGNISGYLGNISGVVSTILGNISG
jgi:hypothetical protein